MKRQKKTVVELALIKKYIGTMGQIEEDLYQTILDSNTMH
jgi:hypothetical protein